MIVRAPFFAGLVTAALCCADLASGAQSLSERISLVRNGSVSFHFAARAGVCGDGARFMRFGNSSMGAYSGRYDDASCVGGPVQVRVVLRDGDVDGLDTWAGPSRERGGHDFGAVSTHDATRYLLGVAAHDRAPASARAILAAVLADSATIWPALLSIARDSSTRSRDTRRDAAFWLSRFADAARSGHPDDLAGDEDATGDDDVKSHALFLLSQLPHGEGVEPLLDAARTSSDRRVRRRALFWLGQSGDARALALFESFLRS